MVRAPTAPDPQGQPDVPRALRGRHRGHHRRPKNYHVPATLGSLALATAAAGALTVGGAASTSTASGSRTTLIGSEVDQHTVLDPAAVAAALAFRSEETVERSSLRELLGESVLNVEALKVRAEAASLDALAGDRQVRFAEAPATWIVPIEGYRLTSMYGARWGGVHEGLDMAAPSGTPIRAMGDGEIVSAQYDGGYGFRTVIRHDDGTETWYCHQSGFEVVSGRVEAGDIIGYVGSTGNSTGPHLHVEVHPFGGEDSINPLTWMRELGLQV